MSQADLDAMKGDMKSIQAGWVLSDRAHLELMCFFPSCTLCFVGGEVFCLSRPAMPFELLLRGRGPHVCLSVRRACRC